MADKPAPKIGHFLPGGEGDQSTTQRSTQGEPQSGTQRDSTPLSAPTPRLGGDAPPVQPQLTGPRIESRKNSLSGTRLGPPPADDAAAEAYRRVFHPDPIPFVPKKRSKVLIAGIVVGALLVAAGVVFFASQVLQKYDAAAENPLGTSTSKPTEPSIKPPIGKGTPDADVLQKNAFYAAGKLPAVKCAEPAFRPTSMENVKSYYQSLIACMDKVWEPIVTKAGFEFGTPRLIIFNDGDETACGIQKDVASYCADEQGGSVTMPWQGFVDDYPKDKAGTAVDMLQSIAFVYGVHVQNLTGILDASDNVRDRAKNKAAELEQDRRQALQGNCFAAAFVGAAKGSYPLQGQLAQHWTYLINHSGDENDKKQPRDHGSIKSHAWWMGQGFAKTDPGTCNTFGAPAARVG